VDNRNNKMHLQIFDAGLRSERYFYENFKDASHLVGTNTHKSNMPFHSCSHPSLVSTFTPKLSPWHHRTLPSPHPYPSRSVCPVTEVPGEKIGLHSTTRGEVDQLKALNMYITWKLHGHMMLEASLPTH
jgi:hypothetical protein